MAGVELLPQGWGRKKEKRKTVAGCEGTLLGKPGRGVTRLA